MRFSTHLVLVASAALAVLAGCQTQRATSAVRESGDRKFQSALYQDAAGEYGIVVDRYPGDWEAQYKLGVCQTELGNLAAARRALEVAHTEKPEKPEVVDALAEVMFRQDDLDRLFAFLRQKAQTHKTTYDYLRWARFADRAGDHDLARTAVDTAITIDAGQSVDPYLLAASLAEKLGHIELAVRRLRQAYGIDPYHETVKDRLRAMGEIPGPTLALPPGR